MPAAWFLSIYLRSMQSGDQFCRFCLVDFSLHFMSDSFSPNQIELMNFCRIIQEKIKKKVDLVLHVGFFQIYQHVESHLLRIIKPVCSSWPDLHWRSSSLVLSQWIRGTETLLIWPNNPLCSSGDFSNVVRSLPQPKYALIIVANLFHILLHP